MARRKLASVPSARAKPLILPRDLVEHDVWRSRHAWLRRHGVDPHDWTVVRPILRASRASHELPLEPAALTRARKQFAEQVLSK